MYSLYTIYITYRYTYRIVILMFMTFYLLLTSNEVLSSIQKNILYQNIKLYDDKKGEIMV